MYAITYAQANHKTAAVKPAFEADFYQDTLSNERLQTHLGFVSAA
jgi:hypothetical protein